MGPVEKGKEKQKKKGEEKVVPTAHRGRLAKINRSSITEWTIKIGEGYVLYRQQENEN